jgi:hypothetical protein
VPLAYVVRENVELPPGIYPSEGYITVAEEMIARVPHGNQAYANDSMEIWSYMANITRAHYCWTYVKPAQRTKTGDALSSCYGITSSDPTTLITWHQKQKLSFHQAKAGSSCKLLVAAYSATSTGLLSFMSANRSQDVVHLSIRHTNANPSLSSLFVCCFQP